MKHTPGPWHARKVYSGRSTYPTYWIAPEGPEPGTPALAKVLRGNRHKHDDAALMAAAPDLLDACEQALYLLVGLDTAGEITMTPEGKDRITAELRAVLAKAKGGAQ